MNLAFIDPGLRKARFLLQLRSCLPHRCFYYSRRRIVRAWIESAGCVAYPAPGRRASALAVSDDDLRVAVGRKELTLRKRRALGYARSMLGELDQFLDECRADAIVVWNGSNLRLALATFLARRRGLRVIYMEHGYLPGTLQMDLEGVNQASSLTRLVLRGEAKLPPNAACDAALDDAIAWFKTGEPSRIVDRKPPERLRLNLFARTYLEHGPKLRAWYVQRTWRKGRALGLDGANPLPRRYVLVPLQVRKDSQLILHSPLVGNDFRTMLRWVEEAVQQVDSRIKVVVKLHPREDVFEQRRQLSLIREFPDVRFVMKAPMRELLSRAMAVVTINSTAGFEAFLYEKPVVALGRNFYTAPHLLEVVTAASELPYAVSKALKMPVPVEQRRAFLRFVSERFLVQGMYNDYSGSSLSAVAARMCELLDPAHVASEAAAHREANVTLLTRLNG